jgi:hypothetical protein
MSALESVAAKLLRVSVVTHLSRKFYCIAMAPTSIQIVVVVRAVGPTSSSRVGHDKANLKKQKQRETVVNFVSEF